MSGTLTVKNINSFKFTNSLNNYYTMLGAMAGGANVDLALPNTNGTLATQQWVNSCGSQLNLCNDLVRLMKVGRLVVCVFYGIDAYTYRTTTLIPDSAAEYRPYGVNPAGYGILFKSETDNYIATIDITQQGLIIINYKNAIATRAVVGNSGHKLYGNMAWFTAS